MDEVYTNIQCSDLKKMLLQKDKYQFIDIRTEEEFRKNSIKGFSNINYYKFLKDFDLIRGLNKDVPVIIICESGDRSVGACKVMNQIGFKELYNVRSGMLDCNL